MDGPLRIAFLDSWRPESFDGSGTAVGIRNLASGLALLGHDVSVIRPRGTTSTPTSRLAYNFRLPRRLLAGPPFHVVVGFDIDGFRWASARSWNSMYVVSLKGIAADEARFSRSRRERLFLSALARLERRNALRADRVLVPSRYSADVASEMYGIPDGRIGLVPEAVDLEPWRAVRASRDAGRRPRDAGADLSGALAHPIILSVARQYPRKDTATLLRAMPSVLSQHPGARLRVIGGGPELGRLARVARELGVSRSVDLQGEVPCDGTVRSAFLDADVFCLPSLQEGFGIAFVEAMAAGLPVVAAQAGAVPEIVADGVAGLLVPPGDPAAVASALIRLLDDPELRARMGSAGAGGAERFDLGLVARRFVEVVGDIRPPKPSSR